jgi:hypothetical protein
MQTIPLEDIQKQVALLQIAERFFDSVTLFALFETGVFKILSSGPKTLQEIQEKICGNEESLRATLDAAVALKLLTLQDGRYGASNCCSTALGTRTLCVYIGEWIAFLHVFITPLAARRCDPDGKNVRGPVRGHER